MAQIIDSFMNSKTEFKDDNKWYISKPIPDTRWKVRIKDTIGVLFGKYTAVYFKADLK